MMMTIMMFFHHSLFLSTHRNRKYRINAAEWIGKAITGVEELMESASPTDASLTDATEYRILSLRDILSVPQYTASLASFMRRNLCLENLTFLLHVQGFQALFREDNDHGRRLGDSGRLEKARRIWSVYMSENATRMVS